MARSSPTPVTVPGFPGIDNTSTGGVPDRSAALNLLVSLRPGQWTKNLPVFAGVLFGHRLLEPEALTVALIIYRPV